MLKQLEIFIVTYNRRKYLERTLRQLFSESSPVRNLHITILNNASTDGTNELIENYRSAFPNIVHIRHPRNIGGNANICRAFELATRPYVWVLCDDDEYCWDHWDEVEQAIAERRDLIVVANYLAPAQSDVNLIKQLTFVPAGIYKTEHFSSGMLINAYYNISSMFPQIAIASVYFNNKLDIAICRHWAVRMLNNEEDTSYTRGVESVAPHPYMKNNYWQFGFAVAAQLFADCKLRERLMDDINLDGIRGYAGYWHMLSICRDHCDSNLRNLTDLFCALNQKQRLEFIKAACDFYGRNQTQQWLAPYTLALPWLFKKKPFYSRWFRMSAAGTKLDFWLNERPLFRLWDHQWCHLRRNRKGTDLVLFNRCKIRIWSDSWKL